MESGMEFIKEQQKMFLLITAFVLRQVSFAVKNTSTTMKKVSSVTKSTDGKDKVLKIFQYLAKLYLSINGQKTLNTERLKRMTQLLSSARKIYRLGRGLSDTANLLGELGQGMDQIGRKEILSTSPSAVIGPKMTSNDAASLENVNRIVDEGVSEKFSRVHLEKKGNLRNFSSHQLSDTHSAAQSEGPLSVAVEKICRKQHTWLDTLELMVKLAEVSTDWIDDLLTIKTVLSFELPYTDALEKTSVSMWLFTTLESLIRNKKKNHLANGKLGFDAMFCMIELFAPQDSAIAKRMQALAGLLAAMLAVARML